MKPRFGGVFVFSGKVCQTSKSPASSRALTMPRNRAASAPSTRRWS